MHHSMLKLLNVFMRTPTTKISEKSIQTLVTLLNGGGGNLSPSIESPSLKKEVNQQMLTCIQHAS